MKNKQTIMIILVMFSFLITIFPTTIADENELSITAPASVYEFDEFIVTILDNNTGLPVEGANVTMENVGKKITDENGNVTFETPYILSDTNYTLNATKEGYLSDEKTISVIDVKKLYIGAPKSATVGRAFKVTGGGDDGNSFGITIIIKDASGTEIISKITEGPDVVKFTILKEGTYTIHATCNGYTDADPHEITLRDYSGRYLDYRFFFLILIIVIPILIIAIILLRRKKKEK